MSKLLFQLTSILDTFGCFAFIDIVARHQDFIYEHIGRKALCLFSFIMWTLLYILNMTGVYVNNLETFDVMEELQSCETLLDMIKKIIWFGGVYTNPAMIPVTDKKTIRGVLTVYYGFKLFVCFEFYREALIYPVMDFL